VVCGVWCVVCGVWCVVCGVWCVVCGVWCVLTRYTLAILCRAVSSVGVAELFDLLFVQRLMVVFVEKACCCVVCFAAVCFSCIVCVVRSFSSCSCMLQRVFVCAV
jgi:hypothetical protein